MVSRSPSYETTQTESDLEGAPFDGASLVLQRVAPRLASDTITLSCGLEIGRDPSCGVQTETSLTSRRHASISFAGHLWRCEDLGSRNGTFVNGRRIHQAPIGPGDVIRCGGWMAIVLRRSTETIDLRFRELADGLFGGPTFQMALDPLRKLAPSTLPVTLEGETGTGKECVARAVHEWSGRTGPYFALNCAALPEALAEAELFGHERGAFTGASQARAGHLRAARGGTLLLDEICDLPQTTQSKLLRALDQREVTPLGASNPIPIDVRIVAAAQQPLEPLVREGRFREDLLARLGTVVRLPPLRNRVEDIPFLFEVFARQSFRVLPELDARVVEALLLHPFPRNVRELRQLADEMALLHPTADCLELSHLPASLRGNGPHDESRATTTTTTTMLAPRGTPDWQRLREAIEHCCGNVRQAARMVGASRYQAYRLLRAHPEFDVSDCRQRRSPPPRS